ncbi:hypothetical protein FGADI_1144 [Fusarium gaditjirri]|uniref:Amine oxidase domain-containing protein n=1 Tax=Fusarium gaditjirri TaxID=282569 RepID=A0A8H4TLI6_9HYPO|nr:hypothetical protein FGADI_1144 [Fusarium gaditjirri]
MNDKHTKTRVAIIGTGLAGLSSAYLIKGDRYRVTLYEQGDRISFDSASVTIKNEKYDNAERIDLPMRASADGYYHNLMRMYHHLQIPLHPIKFLFVFAKAATSADGTVPAKGSDNEAYFIHASNLHQTPPPWPGNRGVIAHFIEIVFLIVCQFWFTIACFLVAPLKTTSSGYSETVAEYFDRIRLPRRYTSRYLLPLLSGVATCTHEELLQFPASDVVNYKKLSHGKQHYAVCGGVSQVQAKLTEGLEDVNLNSRVIEAVSQVDGTVLVRWQSTVDASGRIHEQVFDRVVLSVSPDVAGRIFKPLGSTLAKLPTRQVESSVLKPEKAGISVVDTDNTGSSQSVACMHHSKDTSAAQVLTLRTKFTDMGSPRTEALHAMPSGVVVSTCPLREETQPEAIKKAKFTRTLRNTEGQALVQKLLGDSGSKKSEDDEAMAWVNGQDNVWIAGAWCWDGMVLLEGNTMFFDQDSFGLGFAAGLVTTLAIAGIIALVAMRMSDIYGLGHWKLNITTRPPSMWMNVGYWKTHTGEPIDTLPEASSALLEQVVNAAGLSGDAPGKASPRGSLAILDLGFGCGDQTWKLARMATEQGWRDFRYVGLTLNDAQVQTSRRRIYRELSEAGTAFDAEAFSLFRADAAKPQTWSPQIKEAVYSLTDEKYTERWLLALDCIYHFSPSRKPVLSHAAKDLDANYMAFDLLLNEKASTKDIWRARLIGKMMGCPLKTFLSEAEYRDQLVECGYDRNEITIKEITDHVFSGLVKFLDRQDKLLAEYGITMGGFKLAGRLFNWFDKSRVVRAVVVVARTKSKTG